MWLGSEKLRISTEKNSLPEWKTGTASCSVVDEKLVVVGGSLWQWDFHWSRCWRLEIAEDQERAGYGARRPEYGGENQNVRAAEHSTPTLLRAHQQQTTWSRHGRAETDETGRGLVAGCSQRARITRVCKRDSVATLRNNPAWSLERNYWAGAYKRSESLDCITLHYSAVVGS